MRLAVLGAGSWGTALAITLASRFDTVRIWVRDGQRAVAISQARQNERYLPGFLFPENLFAFASMSETLAGANVILSAIPSHYLRAVWESARPDVPPDAILVSATKGIEEATLLRMSQVLSEFHPSEAIAVLSGPTFAKEIAAGEPAAVVIASEQLALAEHLQQALATASLRFYASRDVVGVEIGAALKNVIAIGAGICRGLGLGSNSVAALVTRGLAEITRLATAMGGQPRTLSGLAGLGDLVLTASGDLSRNRSVGIQLGEGQSLEQILAGMSMVAEGIGTCRAARALGQQEDVDLPIIEQMYQVLYLEKNPREAIRDLMERRLTAE